MSRSASSDAVYALEMGSREATLLGGALADRGQLSSPVRQLFAGSVTTGGC